MARQITTAPTRNDEFSQSTVNRPSDGGLVRQDLQRVTNEIQ
jgi:hypothetical protein